MEFLIVVPVLLLWYALDSQIRKIEARSVRAEALLLRLAEAQGLPDGGWDLAPVRAILAADPSSSATIKAIREYRQQTGASLLDAKNTVDRMRLEE